MGEVSISDGRLTVRLRRWEKVAGLLGDEVLVTTPDAETIVTALAAETP